MRKSLPLICFDVGGVLVRISQSWQEAVQRAGVGWNRAESSPLLLPHCEPMNDYQAGRLEYSQYLANLAVYLGVSDSEAERVHQSILQMEYPGIPELICDIKSKGHRTAILSNTNGPHWEHLLNPKMFPTVASVDSPHASHLIGHGKPDPTIYNEFNRLTHTSPHDVIFFDDNQDNVNAANTIGWHAHRIDPWGDPAAQMRAILQKSGLL